MQINMKLSLIISIFFIAFSSQAQEVQSLEIVRPPHIKVYSGNSKPKLINGEPYTGTDSSYITMEGEKILAIETYQDGFKTELKTFFDNSFPQCHFEFKKGKKDGINRRWYKNGMVMFDYRMKDGKAVGSHALYYEDGKMESYFDDEHGISMGFYKSGKLSSFSKKIRDSVKCQGIHGYEGKTWYENGQLRTHGILNCGKQFDRIYANDSTILKEETIIGINFYRVGKYSEFYGNGKPKLIGYYQDGNSIEEANIKTGVWKYWNESGQLIKEEHYEKNKLIKEKKYNPDIHNLEKKNNK